MDNKLDKSFELSFKNHHIFDPTF